MSTCPHCGEDVLEAVLAERSRTTDKRGWADEVRLRLAPAPSSDPRANVLVSEGRCGYVSNWDMVRAHGLPVYLRHSLVCINPLGIKKYRGINWEPEDDL